VADCFAHILGLELSTQAISVRWTGLSRQGNGLD
jgi:hypothetical protein